jgi:hypothetical protein
MSGIGRGVLGCAAPHSLRRTNETVAESVRVHGAERPIDSLGESSAGPGWRSTTDRINERARMWDGALTTRRRRMRFVNVKSPYCRDMAINGIGRPSKGQRDAILAKPPGPFAAILKENAEKNGYSYGDYLLALAAQALEMPQFAPAPARPRADQLKFPEEAATAAA